MSLPDYNVLVNQSGWPHLVNSSSQAFLAVYNVKEAPQKFREQVIALPASQHHHSMSKIIKTSIKIIYSSRREKPSHFQM